MKLKSYIEDRLLNQYFYEFIYIPQVTKHTMAITNRGGASAEDIFAIARAVRAGVAEKFGIELVPEPSW